MLYIPNICLGRVLVAETDGLLVALCYRYFKAI